MKNQSATFFEVDNPAMAAKRDSNSIPLGCNEQDKRKEGCKDTCSFKKSRRLFVNWVEKNLKIIDYYYLCLFKI
ncbi:MAG: hypothetical protein LBU84_03080 [Prevotella sp.]|nr:hypothetical protein [Prevotella sp.]